MCCIAEQRETPRPDTTDQLTEEDTERDKHRELELPLQMRLMAMRVCFAMMMGVVAVIVQNVSLWIEGNSVL